MILTKRHYLAAAVAAILAIALGVTAATLPKREKKLEATAVPVTVTVPETTPIHVTLDQAVASDENRPGDHFEATVSEPVVIDGQTVIPKGALAEGLVVDARRSGRLRGRARLQLALQGIQVNGSDYDIRTTSSWRTGGDHKKRNLGWIGGGAGGGLLIGALAGGGKGALIGGPIGAAAGTTVALVTGKKDIHLRPETRLTFKLAEPLTVPTKG